MMAQTIVKRTGLVGLFHLVEASVDQSLVMADEPMLGHRVSPGVERL